MQYHALTSVGALAVMQHGCSHSTAYARFLESRSSFRGEPDLSLPVSPGSAACRAREKLALKRVWRCMAGVGWGNLAGLRLGVCVFKGRLYLLAIGHKLHEARYV